MHRRRKSPTDGVAADREPVDRGRPAVVDRLGGSHADACERHGDEQRHL
jgi:hypothetical protein